MYKSEECALFVTADPQWLFPFPGVALVPVFLCVFFHLEWATLSFRVESLVFRVFHSDERVENVLNNAFMFFDLIFRSSLLEL